MLNLFILFKTSFVISVTFSNHLVFFGTNVVSECFDTSFIKNKRRKIPSSVLFSVEDRIDSYEVDFEFSAVVCYL